MHHLLVVFDKKISFNSSHCLISTHRRNRKLTFVAGYFTELFFCRSFLCFVFYTIHFFILFRCVFRTNMICLSAPLCMVPYIHIYPYAVSHSFLLILLRFDPFLRHKWHTFSTLDINGLLTNTKKNYDCIKKSMPWKTKLNRKIIKRTERVATTLRDERKISNSCK